MRFLCIYKEYECLYIYTYYSCIWALRVNLGITNANVYTFSEHGGIYASRMHRRMYSRLGFPIACEKNQEGVFMCRGSSQHLSQLMSWETEHWWRHLPCPAVREWENVHHPVWSSFWGQGVLGATCVAKIHSRSTTTTTSVLFGNKSLLL